MFEMLSFFPFIGEIEWLSWLKSYVDKMGFLDTVTASIVLIFVKG